MKSKYVKTEIDMDATNEILRRMDAIEKRVADLKKEVVALKAKSKTPVKAKSPYKKDKS
jgi:tetrahydromethanopterin S-methyltransferase subunit G